MFYHPCQTILSQSNQINAIFGKIGRLALEEVILELVKNKCMPSFVVWTRMLYFAKKFFEIVRLCYRTILNETI